MLRGIENIVFSNLNRYSDAREAIVRAYLKDGFVPGDTRKLLSGYHLPNVLIKEFLRSLEIIETADEETSLLSLLNTLGEITLLGKKDDLYNPNLSQIIESIRTNRFTKSGTALIVTTEDNFNNVLIGNDFSNPDQSIGKTFGSISFPMGYSKWNEDSLPRVMRICQRELWTNQTLRKEFPKHLIPGKLEPFLFLKIAHVIVECYWVKVPREIIKEGFFNSDKITNFRFVSPSELTKKKNNRFRWGISEITDGFLSHVNALKYSPWSAPIIATSQLNKAFSGSF